MLKDILRNTPLYTPLNSLQHFFRNQANRREINRRLACGDLLQDLSKAERIEWQERIDTVCAAPDNHKIECVSNAGTFRNGCVTMHNGLRIEPLGYYGYPILQMLLKNRGIHEPQEEFAFQEVLKEIPSHACMLELGAYWSFYSMWFQASIPGAKNFMIEPWHFEQGKRNFRLNRLKGTFKKAYVGAKDGVADNGVPTITIDTFIEQAGIEHIHVLHSDIQGAELAMLEGARDSFKAGKISYAFISTHSQSLHEQCKELLSSYDLVELCSANLTETYSYDGLLVFKKNGIGRIDHIPISRRE